MTMYVDAEEVKLSKRKPRPESLSSSARLKKGYTTGGIDVLSDAVGQGGASHMTSEAPHRVLRFRGLPKRRYRPGDFNFTPDGQ